MGNVVITLDERPVAVVLLHGEHPREEAVRAVLTRHWQDVMEQAAPQYPKLAETFIPNAKPLIVEDAIQREVWRPIAHYLHPDHPSGRTALCGVEILGVPTAGAEFTLCNVCAVLRQAQDWAPLAP
jgi:hypothetical protein